MHTQNNNEFLNSSIWTFAPKYIHSSKGIVDIANFLAVCIFNDGYMNILKIMDMMDIIIGKSVHDLSHSQDEH